MKIEDEIKQPAFKDDYQKAYINLVFTAGWLQLRQSALFKEYGLTLPQFNILRILRGQHPKPATVNLLIERMLDKTSNASRIVDKLEAKALVTRKVCPSNRRAVDIRITEDGLELLQRLDAVMAAQSTGLQNLTAQEAAQLSDLLDKIRD
ncbi:DNA-binding MarR family transcriptional regulator [Hymenobacter luteus]|uniref:DNA-binding MarR family transcriptional regulator n=2 Tax=Hymenobacter TaxID=89966 RepID=A0A7W9T064_9BACT|nr:MULTISPECIES: MarR family transcriptional regulator [Hymenobacter]MBB4600788.1 DNA-binding MarR family transcriptional regulator [Hymenobacter latericoloratus]MBB6059005.1 DNA-binding MarR family transcriptional regulator [Hymenobacter luteus]